ncbi:hypothetical protein A1O3_05075 [Capronia epimyces CBS 606.96]|uniref:Protection of telomeres protein 1 n=1 Tax=Capronia epimyces CBS 606.96 TaxID=1182542 RepID=W9XW18_9EURO|nr:uncharacterized protein A1O3_05075 [Capronia epimyces CBS 606.96]EXJ84408.1 hypothetical protein A1O3_05075 [Capronia epimyces CBS 606.96]
MDPGPIPANCISLKDAFARSTNEHYHIMGVCVDFLEPVLSRGSDFTMKLTLHDRTWEYGCGMTFRFFCKQLKHLPTVQNQGDVVILRNFKTINTRGEIFGISNIQSEWVILPATALAESDSVQDVQRQARWSGQDDPINRHQKVFNEHELRYARWLADQEDAAQWRPLLGSTKLQRDHIISSNGGKTSPYDGKFRLIKDLEVPQTNKYLFVELLGEVRRIYGTDFRTELYVSDYTINDRLYEYRYGDNEGGREGDPFGYIEDSSSKWPGPWGKMTMNITLFDSHSVYAQSAVKEGTFVYLRNVQIKMDRNGSQLEGCCRGDRSNPTKVNVDVRKPHEGVSDERMKALLLRKREYETKAKAENLRFVRNAQVAKKRQNEGADEPKSKKTKTRNRKKKESRAKDEAEQRSDEAAAASEKTLTKPNGTVRCENVSVPCKTIMDIVDPDILVRTTAKGTTFRLPFQNSKYKANVRVVDFFPDDIADFAAPRQKSEYDCLSDCDNPEDSDIDLTQNHENEVKWEWRFFLLVEDAAQQMVGGGRRARIELLVADRDGDYLLNMEACNLRDKSNARELAKVKERLFHLWGDLQERKEESATVEESSMKPSARPFQCLIKEYGVPIRSSSGQPKDSFQYERVFGLFGTTISC